MLEKRLSNCAPIENDYVSAEATISFVIYSQHLSTNIVFDNSIQNLNPAMLKF